VAKKPSFLSLLLQVLSELVEITVDFEWTFHSSVSIIDEQCYGVDFDLTWRAVC
jgi:hypothetical protein